MKYRLELFSAFSRMTMLGLGLAVGSAFAAGLETGATRTQGLAGRWDLTIRDSKDQRFASWLELSRDQAVWKARLVGRWGNARPLPQVQVTGNAIRFVSPKQEEDSQTDLVFEGTLNGELLKGRAQGPNGSAWTWSGKRAPALKPPAQLNWGQPITLFNRRDFSGWTFDNPTKASSWGVETGCLVNKSAGSNIATDQHFQNFRLHIEVNCPTNANSGIYLRGRYEVQVEDDSIQEPPSHHMGAIYGFVAPDPEPPRRPGTWQTFDITLVGRFVTVVQNGRPIIRDQEIAGFRGGAVDSQEELPGPIYLQGDHGGIAFRNIILTPAMP